MEKAPKELSASALRKLLIVEVQKFITSLDYASTDELQQKKDRLKEILQSLTEKERHEMARILWGRNAPPKMEDPPKIEDDPPKIEDDSPKIEDDSPKIEDDSPKIEDDSPKIEETPDEQKKAG